MLYNSILRKSSSVTFKLQKHDILQLVPVDANYQADKRIYVSKEACNVHPYRLTCFVIYIPT